MESETQFDLDEAIRNWHEHLNESSRLSAEELEELELHLRDSVNALQKRGLSQEEAWIIAERRLGKRQALKKEFAKVALPAKAVATGWERLSAAMQIPTPTAAEILRRIVIMERNIVLPVKAVAIAILLYSFYSSPWFTNISSALEIGVEAVREMLWAYVAVNLLAAGVFLAARRVPLTVLQRVVFAIMLMDGVFILTITIVVGGAEGLYWLFPALLVRAAFSVPRFSSQVLVSLTLMICYLFACFIENGLVYYLNGPGFGVMNTFPAEAQPILLRFLILLLVVACCYGTQILVQRNNAGGISIAD
jgi:hypothetical protein